MGKGFRTEMTWLHTWSGLILGWLLFAIFVTGTSAYYKNEITLWMQPELHKSVESEKTLDIAIQKGIEATKSSTNVSINLPDSRSNTIKIMARTGNAGGGHSHGPGGGAHVHGPNGEEIPVANLDQSSTKGMQVHNNGGGAHTHGPNGEEIPISNVDQGVKKGAKNQNAQKASTNKQQNKRGGRPKPKVYDASTGEELKGRTTAGGNFLYKFHFELYSMPRDIARWIVAIATMFMFTAIISGIIIHKRIFKDIFTFRPKNNPRGWMDAHILPGVAALPFLIMITYSGLILLTNPVMPWAQKVHFGDNPRGMKQQATQNTKQQGEKSQKQSNKNVSSKSEVKLESRNTNMQRGNTQKGFESNSNKRASKDQGQRNGKAQRNNNDQRASKDQGQRNSKAQRNSNNKRVSQEVKSQTQEKVVSLNKDYQRITNTNALRAINKYDNKNAHRIVSAKLNRQLTVYKNTNKGSKKEQSKDLNGITKDQILAVLKKAEKIWPNNVGAFSLIKDATTNTFTIQVNPKDKTSIFSFKRDKESATYEAKTAKLISQSTVPTTKSVISNTNTALVSLHQALFADSTLRFILFICGIFGTVLAGTGLILWTEKRKKKNQDKKSFGFWLVEKLNLGTIMGIFIAIAIYFIANRLIPADDSARSTTEVYSFFTAWGLSYAYAFIRDTKKAWKELLMYGIYVYLHLPIINAITSYESISSIYNRDNILINFDIFFIFMALVFVLVLFILRRKEKKQNMGETK